MKVLVTGATGFIGAEIVSELLRNNINVCVVTSSEKKAAALAQKNAAEVFVADIISKESFSELENLKEIDAVIHSAGLAHQFGDTKKEAFDAVNVEGARNVANLAVFLRAKHFILIGSTAVYGNQKNPDNNLSVGKSRKFASVDEDFSLKPQTLYAKSKLEAEKICIEICEKNNLPLTVFRLAPVIGESNVGNVARLIEAIDRRRFVWIGKGENYKSLIYKNDVARACVELLRKKTGGTEIFNLAAEPLPMKKFVAEIAAHLNKKNHKLFIPENLLRKIFRINSRLFKIKKVRKIEETVEKWLADDVYSADKIKTRYGFESKTSIAEAVERQIEWYRKNKKLK